MLGKDVIEESDVWTPFLKSSTSSGATATYDETDGVIHYVIYALLSS